MDKISKKTLEYLVKNGGCRYTVNFQEELDEMVSNLNMDSEDLRANIRFLKNKGYIEYQKIANSDRVYAFYLSHEGMNYKEFSAEAIKAFLLTSIFVPLSVSLIASILTAIIINHFLS